MMTPFTTSLLKAIPYCSVLALVIFFASGFSRSHGEAALSSDQLAAVRGKDDHPGCIQYFADWENRSFDCWSPYLATDNDCDWKLCTSSDEADGCGTGTRWSGLNQASWIATNVTDPDIGWRAKSSPCTGIIDCSEGLYNDQLSCSPSNLIGHFLNEDPRVRGQGCHDPDPGTQPTGCRTCSAGMPDPFHPNNTNWIWYESGPCPLGE